MSMEDNENNFDNQQVDFQPLPTPPSSTTPKPTTRKRQINKAEKSNIQQFHRDNPFVTHNHIAGLFGLERSTVSKILSQASIEPSPPSVSIPPSFDQQFAPQAMQDRNGFMPHTTPSSVQRALFNWAQQTQRAGIRVTQPMLRQQAANLATMAWADQRRPSSSGSMKPEMWNPAGLDSNYRPHSNNSPIQPPSLPTSGPMTPVSAYNLPFSLPDMSSSSNMPSDPNIIPISMDDVLTAMNSSEVCPIIPPFTNAGEAALNTLQEVLGKSVPLTPFDYLCLEHLREKLIIENGGMHSDMRPPADDLMANFLAF